VVSTTDLGQRAETAACGYLEGQGYKIIARNWRNRWCELDIVAEKAGVVHIVEVKYRSNLDYGTGLEYIGHDKLKRLTRAASMFMTSHGRGRPYQIDVIAISGELNQPAIMLAENITA